MKILLVLPILLPFFTAVAAVFLRRRSAAQRGLGCAGAAGLALAALALLAAVRLEGIQALQVGAWPAPFGITVVADLFSAVMVLVSAVIGLAVAVYSLGEIDERRESFGYYPMLHILLMGVSGSFLAGDLFNLYVWFEVMLVASFGLLALGGESAQLEGTVKYVSLNLISSLFLLVGVGLMYGSVGTLNMAELALHFRAASSPVLGTVLAMLFLVAFGIKAAVFPLFFWLPASYHTPPSPVSAVFAGLLTKVGVYAMIRVFTLIFVRDAEYTHRVILVLAAFTMVTGVLGALAQNEFRRILAFHIVSQIGYMILGLGIFTPLALAGSIFYIFHHILVKTNLFLVSGMVNRFQGSYALSDLGGLYRREPALAFLFLVPALSLAGLPPLSGFWGKLFLVKAALDSREYTYAALALAVGLMTLLSMTKIWSEVFWKEPPGRPRDVSPPRPGGRIYLFSPIAMLAFLTVLIGLWTEPFFRIAAAAAEQLADPQSYIRAVLGGNP